MDRRTFAAALAALAVPIPAMSSPPPVLALQDGRIVGALQMTVDSSALEAAIDVLQRAAERFPGVAEALSDVVLEFGDSLRCDLIELRNVSTGRADHMLISFDLSDRFREIVAAARAGEVDRLRSYRVVQVHGGPRGG